MTVLRSNPLSLQQRNLMLRRTAPGQFLNTQLWNTSHAFVNSLFSRQARPQNSTLSLPAAQFRQRSLPHPLHHLGGTKANHRVEGVLGIRLSAVYSWSGSGKAGLRGPSLPLNAATAAKEQSQQRQRQGQLMLWAEKNAL